MGREQIGDRRSVGRPDGAEQNRGHGGSRCGVRGNRRGSLGGRERTDRGVLHVHDEESSGPVRAQSAYGRERADTSVECAGVQSGQDIQECRERTPGARVRVGAERKWQASCWSRGRRYRSSGGTVLESGMAATRSEDSLTESRARCAYRAGVSSHWGYAGMRSHLNESAFVLMTESERRIRGRYHDVHFSFYYQ